MTDATRRLVVPLLGVAGLVLAACGSTAQVESSVDDAAVTVEPSVAQVDDAPESDFPQFTATTVDGGQFEFGSLEGQDTVLWFWAPW